MSNIIPPTEIKYDTPFEVTKNQYDHLMTKFDGVVCGRIEDNKYYIKVFMTRYAKEVMNALKNVK